MHTRRAVLPAMYSAGLVALLAILPSVSHAVEIQSICRLKGQEPIRLRGVGLVIGLNGTGDQRLEPMHRTVQQALTKQGLTVNLLQEVASIRNVALVMVSCEIPGVGAREGGQFDCFVASIGTARSLAGGRLIQSAVTLPELKHVHLGQPQPDMPAFAIAEGPLTIENAAQPNQARIENGARLIRDMPSPYLLCDDIITLVIDNSHAGFVTADRLAHEINRMAQVQLTRPGEPREDIARAMDARNIQVWIPKWARQDKVSFISTIMTTRIFAPNTEARVIVNEKSGTIVVTGEVEVTPVLIAHNNLLLYPGLAAAGLTAAPIGPPFVPLASTDPPFPGQPGLANLNDLLIAMNRAQVPAVDKIAIIRELEKSGKLHSKVIWE